jgi:UDP:flavonoid glycosyltransferase YjiC (YdhE family)
MASSPQCFAFIFPEWVGHINPSLPVARSLIERGHTVHYVCFETMRGKIEGTGAVFHSAVECEPELFQGRGTDFIGMVLSLAEEFEGVGQSTVARLWQLQPIMVELQLPGLLRLLRKLEPQAIVFCPLSSPEAGVAARILGIPSIALNTFAGPGGAADAITWCFEEEKIVYQEFDHKIRHWSPNVEAAERVRENYGVSMQIGLSVVPGHLDSIAHSAVTLSTTADGLQLPMSPELEQAYAESRSVFEYVGPLLDRAGTWRSHLLDSTASHDTHAAVARVRSARAEGRPVIFASMGTVITGDMPLWGWEGRPLGIDGMPFGLSGFELCRAAWAGVFDAFGHTDALIILALGPQPNALGTIEEPPNAVCAPAFPQVDILSAGVDVFLTHGGQNSFMEAMSCGTPVVVCPGFSDQIANSRKSVALGVGLKVDRPVPVASEEAAAILQYRADVCKALGDVVSNSHFAAAAGRCADMVKAAGGVSRAADLMLAVANNTCRPYNTAFGGA